VLDVGSNALPLAVADPIVEANEQQIESVLVPRPPAVGRQQLLHYLRIGREHDVSSYFNRAKPEPKWYLQRVSRERRRNDNLACRYA
jgi:hypothetical protein